MPAESEPNNARISSDTLDPGDDSVWRLLSIYADGEASPQQTAEVEQLLSANPTYAKDLQFLRVTGKAVQSIFEAEPPITLRDAILGATTRRQTAWTQLVAVWRNARRSLAPGARVTLSVGGLVAATVLAVALWPRSESPKELAHTIIRATPGTSGLPSVNHAGSKVAANITPLPQGSQKSPIQPNIEKLHSATGAHGNITLAKFVPPGPTIKKAMVNGTAVALGPKQAPPASGSPQDADYMLGDPNHVATRTDDVNRHMANRGNNPPPPISPPDVTPVTGASKPDPTSGEASTALTAVRTTPEPRVTVAKLPPEAYQYLTNAQMKQQRDATTLGYDRDTVKSIQRKELTVSFIKGSL